MKKVGWEKRARPPDIARSTERRERPWHSDADAHDSLLQARKEKLRVCLCCEGDRGLCQKAFSIAMHRNLLWFRKTNESCEP